MSVKEMRKHILIADDIVEYANDIDPRRAHSTKMNNDNTAENNVLVFIDEYHF